MESLCRFTLQEFIARAQDGSRLAGLLETRLVPPGVRSPKVNTGPGRIPSLRWPGFCRARPWIPAFRSDWRFVCRFPADGRM